MTKILPKRHHFRPAPPKRAPSPISLRRFPVIACQRDGETSTIQRLGSGIVTDISTDGIGLILDRPIRRGIEVLLVLNADSPREQLLEALALGAGELPCSGHVLKAGSHGTILWRITLKFNGMDLGQVNFIAAVLRGEEPSVSRLAAG